MPAPGEEIFALQANDDAPPVRLQPVAARQSPVVRESPVLLDLPQAETHGTEPSAQVLREIGPPRGISRLGLVLVGFLILVGAGLVWFATSYLPGMKTAEGSAENKKHSTKHATQPSSDQVKGTSVTKDGSDSLTTDSDQGGVERIRMPHQFQVSGGKNAGKEGAGKVGSSPVLKSPDGDGLLTDEEMKRAKTNEEAKKSPEGAKGKEAADKKKRPSASEIMKGLEGKE